MPDSCEKEISDMEVLSITSRQLARKVGGKLGGMFNLSVEGILSSSKIVPV